jgi:hypothetical protein
MHDHQQQQQQQQEQQGEEFHQSQTTTEQEANAMRREIIGLQHQLRVATEQLNQYFEFRSALIAGRFRELRCPKCHQQGLVHDPFFGQTQHSTLAETMNGQLMQHSSTGLNIDLDKEPDAPWTPLGQWQMWHMRGILPSNLQNSSIDEQTCQFTGRASLVDEIGQVSNFDAMAPLAGIESTHPRLALHHFTGDVWDTSQIKSEEATMRDQCYLPPGDVQLGYAMDQRPEFTTDGIPSSVNGDPSNQRSFAFQPAARASLYDFN